MIVAASLSDSPYLQPIGETGAVYYANSYDSIIDIRRESLALHVLMDMCNGDKADAEAMRRLALQRFHNAPANWRNAFRAGLGL